MQNYKEERENLELKERIKGFIFLEVNFDRRSLIV